MLYRHLPSLNRDLSRLVLGSMVMHVDVLDLVFQLLDGWTAAGGNVVDTAHLYQGGSSERAIGKWMEARGCRREVVILTKGAHHNQDRQRVTPEDILCDLRDSLARLRTDYVDLYVLHRDDPRVPVGEIVDALNRLRASGQIRAFGGSNWSPGRLEAANAYAAEHILERFTVSSPHFSLAVPNEPVWPTCLDARSPEDMAWYQRTGMPLFAWSSQARGFFTGAFTPGNVAENEFISRVYASPGNWERLRRARELGAAPRPGAACYSAIQVALAWVLHQPFPVFPLIGPATPAELASSLAALQLKLSAEEVAWLDLRDA